MLMLIKLSKVICHQHTTVAQKTLTYTKTVNANIENNKEEVDR